MTKYQKALVAVAVFWFSLALALWVEFFRQRNVDPAFDECGFGQVLDDSGDCVTPTTIPLRDEAGKTEELQ